MDDFTYTILKDNLQLFRKDIQGQPIEVLGLTIENLFESLIGEYDLGEQRAILYDIATVAVIAAESTYSEEE